MAVNRTASRGGPRRHSPSRAGARRKSLWQETWRRFRRHRLAIVGACVLAVMVAAVLVGPLVYRVPINDIDFKAKLKGPSWAHPLGTDDLGQDLLARMLYGGRISLAVGVAAMLIAISVGTAVGAVAGHAGGWMDHSLMRITDLFLSLPSLPLLLLIVYLFRDALKKALRPGGGRLHPDRGGDRRPALDARGAARPRAVPVPAREGVRRGGPKPGGAGASARSSATSCPMPSGP